MIFRTVNFYSAIITIGISISQFVLASNASSSSNTPVCIDNFHLMEIYQFCIDRSDPGISNNINDLNISIRSLDDMINECPQDEHYIRMVRASCLVKGNKLSEALSDYQFVLSLNPDAFFIHREIGSIYHKQGKYDKAIKEFTVEINKSKNSYQDYIYRAMAHKEAGNRELALSDYKESLKLLNERDGPQSECESCYSPTAVGIYLEMGDLLEQGGDIQQAVILYKEGLDNNPGSLELKDKLKSQ